MLSFALVTLLLLPVTLNQLNKTTIGFGNDENLQKEVLHNTSNLMAKWGK